MEYNIAQGETLGRYLWMSDGRTEAAVALDYGIRIVHFSCRGMKNLFYEQPKDADSLSTAEGWRIHAGHRLWLAPEGEADYYPDNLPVSYERKENGAVLCQPEDPWLHVNKRMELTFLADGTLQVDHIVQNTDDKTRRCALWAVTSTAAGGRASVPFAWSGCEEEKYQPCRFLSLWGTTSLNDRRITFTPEGLDARQAPGDDYFKMGLQVREGRAVLLNFGQRMTLQFGFAPGSTYPDNGCNFELYLCRQMMELETLSPLYLLEPGQSAAHRELWRVEPVSPQM